MEGDETRVAKDERTAWIGDGCDAVLSLEPHRRFASSPGRRRSSALRLDGVEVIEGVVECFPDFVCLEEEGKLVRGEGKTSSLS